jgi:NAD-dependent protein deacetylase/lipoamidase
MWVMRVLVATGAGVSAESGIPTFRGSDGYWRNLDPAKLATPEAFRNDPKLVWDWYNERRERIRNAQPNPAHQAIVKLAAHASEFLLVTQNVDDLHLRAQWQGHRLSPDKIVRIHGDIFKTRCSRCDFAFNGRGGSPRQSGSDTPGSRAISANSGRLRSTAPTSTDEGDLPRCPVCGELMRPGVVWFGEQLDMRNIARIENYLDRASCDIVIVAGTTAAFGYIIEWALRARGDDGQLVEVNPDPTALSPFATELIREPAGVALPRIVDELLALHHHPERSRGIPWQKL